LSILSIKWLNLEQHKNYRKQNMYYSDATDYDFNLLEKIFLNGFQM